MLMVTNEDDGLTAVLSAPNENADIERVFEETCEEMVKSGFVLYGPNTPHMSSRLVFTKGNEFVTLTILPG